MRGGVAQIPAQGTRTPPPREGSFPKRAERAPALLWPSFALVLVTLAVYWPALQGGFLWEDDIMLKNNPYVKSPAGLYYIWCSTKLPDFFPLTSTSLWLEWMLWGMNPLGYHVTNVLLHAASGVLLWRVLRRLAIPGAWLAALLFAIHPVNVDSVAWITERKNTLAMVFFLLSILWFLRSEEWEESKVQSPKSKVRWYGLSLLAFLLALLSKTAVVMGPFVLLLCVWWRRREVQSPKSKVQSPEAKAPSSKFQVQRSAFGSGDAPPTTLHAPRSTLHLLARVIPFFALSLALGLVTIWFQYHRAIGNDVVQTAGFWTRLATAGRAVWFYAGKTVLPWPLSFVYPRWQTDVHSLFSWLPLAGLVLGVGLCWRWRRRTWARAALFALGSFVAMLLPVLGFANIYFQRYSLVADHWQYFAIIAPIALVVGGFSSKFKVQSGTSLSTIGLCVAMAVVLTLSVLSWQRCGLYQSQAALWLDTLNKNPGCWMAHNNLGLLLVDNPQTRDEALQHYHDSLRLNPEQDEAHLNLGAAMLKLNRLEDAWAEFERARHIDPTYPLVYYNLGLVLDEQGKFSEAQAQYRHALDLHPDYAEAHNNLGAALQMEGKLPEAEPHFAEAVRLQPGLVRARNNLGLALQARGKSAEAIAQFREALRLQPDYPEALNNLGKTFAEQGKLGEAAAQFARAAQLKPEYADAHYNLGNTLSFQGKFAEAVPSYRWALQVRPDFPAAQQALGAALAALGKSDEAIGHFSQALRLKPDLAEAHYQWGAVLLKDRKTEEAAAHFETALKSRPDYAEAHYQLAVFRAERKRASEAIAHYREAVRLRPDWLEALNNLAWLLATQSDANLRSGPEAIRLASHAVELTHTNNPGTLDTLAAGYAELGRFTEATATVQRALQLADAAGQKEMAAELEKRRQSYQAGRPFRE